MKYGDFSSLIQLGVGLHVGTAVLQLYGELGVEPLVRAIKRMRSLFRAPDEERPSAAIKEELDDLEHRYEVFKIRLFHEYKKYVIGNSIVALILAALLTIITFKADDAISEQWQPLTILFVFLSICPSPISLGILWADANRLLKPLKKEADDLERRALAGK